jgi:hypothetical protein
MNYDKHDRRYTFGRSGRCYWRGKIWLSMRFFFVFLLFCTYAWSGFLPWDLSYSHSSVRSIGNLFIVDILESHLLAFGFALGLD